MCRQAPDAGPLSGAVRRSLPPGTDLAIALLLLVLSAGNLWFRSHVPSPGIDYYQFWIVGRGAGGAGFGDVYSAEGRSRLAALGSAAAAAPGAGGRIAAAAEMRPRVETFSTPFLYAALSWPATGDYDRDYGRFQLSSLAAAAAAVVVLGILLGYPPAACLLGLAVLFLGFKPILSDVQVGNVARLQLAGIAVYLALQRSRRPALRDVGGGVVLGLLVLFKPNTLPMAALLAVGWGVTGRWRKLALHAAGAAAGATVAVVASLFPFGSFLPWAQWLAALPAIGRESDLSVAQGNVSLGRFLSEAGLPDPSWALLIGAFALVTLSLLRSRGAPERPHGAAPRDDRRDLLVAGIGATLPLVGFRLAWLHYAVLAIPLIACLAGPHPVATPGAAAGRGAARATLLALAVLLLFGAPLDVLRGHGPALPSLEMFAGAAILIGLGIADLRSARGC